MLQNPKSVANLFLKLANDSGEKLSPLKLQKLVYYAHGWYAGYTGRPLLNEPVKAWQYGPVVASLFEEFKQFGAGKIESPAADFDGVNLVFVDPPRDEGVCLFLASIWKSYGKFTAITLSEMAHAPGSPWDSAWKENVGLRSVDIPFGMIAAHFKAAAAIALHEGQPTVH